MDLSEDVCDQVQTASLFFRMNAASEPQEIIQKTLDSLIQTQ